jgi:hypothetical protein
VLIFEVPAYVDDILSTYDQKKTNIDKAQAAFNEQQPIIKFTMRKEALNPINFVGLLIQRKEKEFEYTIHRKPTQTHIIILNDCCHPCEHKILSIKYIVNRFSTYSVSKEAKGKTKHHKTHASEQYIC